MINDYGQGGLKLLDLETSTESKAVSRETC